MLTLKEGTRPPWVALGASVWVQIASGNSFTFPLYSHSLKSVLGFSQTQITLLGVANDIGENVGLIPGLACNKFPPWVILLIGSMTSFFGYGVLWLALTEMVQNIPYVLLWIALAIGSNSSAWLTTSVLVTNMRNFPINRGTVAGILKGYGGLSAGVFTLIYSSVVHNSSPTFLLFLAIGIPAVCFCLMFLVRPCTPASREDPAENVNFLLIQGTSMVLGVYLLATTLIGNIHPLSDAVSYILVAVMVLFLMAPLAIPLKMTLFPRRASNPEAPGQKGGSSEDLIQDEKTEPLLASSSAGTLGSFSDVEDLSDVAMLLAVGEGAVVKKKRRPKRGEDFKFTEAIIKADFWLLSIVFFVGVGTGVTVLNNLAQIGIAQGEEDTTTLMAIFSFCNFVGRLGGGVVSEFFLRKKLIPRTVWMTWTQMIMLIVYLLFAYAIKGTLYPAVALLGVCYGMQVSLVVPAVSELFGLKHFGVLINFIFLGNPLGAFLLSALLAGRVYDNETAKQHGLGLIASSAACIGPNCFKITFFVLAGVSALGTILSIILTYRVKPVYIMLYSGGSFRVPSSH